MGRVTTSAAAFREDLRPRSLQALAFVERVALDIQACGRRKIQLLLKFRHCMYLATGGKECSPFFIAITGSPSKYAVRCSNSVTLQRPRNAMGVFELSDLAIPVAVSGAVKGNAVVTMFTAGRSAVW
jgi:hypothetical protein